MLFFLHATYETPVTLPYAVIDINQTNLTIFEHPLLSLGTLCCVACWAAKASLALGPFLSVSKHRVLCCLLASGVQGEGAFPQQTLLRPGAGRMRGGQAAPGGGARAHT